MQYAFTFTRQFIIGISIIVSNLDMKKIFLLIIILSTIPFYSCNKYDQELSPQLIPGKVNDIYRFYCGKIKNDNIWIVDGEKVRNEILPDFIFGGNEMRYPFIPKNEIWISNDIPAIEYETTLEHEINERDLMRDLGWSYANAHDSSLQIEIKLRRGFEKGSTEHEASIPLVYPMDSDSIKQIKDIPDKIKIKNIYVQKLDKIDSISVWLVNGSNVRRDIFPDFCPSGGPVDYLFIPKNEIWIDGEISCEDMFYGIMLERKLFEEYYRTDDYTSATETADKFIIQKRKEMNDLIARQPKINTTPPLTKD
ncbi:hypothetical protein BH10BAC5_BH10BAC5_11830 [soil metagenome]